MRSLLLILLCVGSAVAAEPGPVLSQTPPGDGIVVAGEIDKAAFTATLAQGPQRFIAGLQVRPVMEGRTFRGFELIATRPDSPLAGSMNVRSGDVIVSVNGIPVERPDQFMKAWEGLAKAAHIDVKLRRAGNQMVYRWTIGR